MPKEERIKIINKAKKLKELANRGVGGEKEVAQQMLDKYIKEHNITTEEIKVSEEGILIEEFRSSSYRYMSSGKLKSLFFNYELREFGIRENMRDIFHKSLSFSNYEDILRRVTIMSNGEVKAN